MAIIDEYAETICEARGNGMCFDSLITLGRQNNCLTARRLPDLAARCGIAGYPPSIATDRYMDRFFRVFLGVKTSDAVDVSAYERAALHSPRNHRFFKRVIRGC